MKNAVDDISTERIFKVNSLDKLAIKEIKSALDVNPPLHSDIQRQIKTYTAKVQFVELSFEGSNVNSKDVQIPSDALPFKDKKIKDKLTTKMKLFDDIIAKKGYKPLLDLKNSIKEMRDSYLIPLSSKEGKSIIKSNDKNIFIERVEEIRESIPEFMDFVNEFLETEILNSEDRIRNELKSFLKENPPDNIKNLTDNTRQRKIEQYVNSIIGSIKFPDAKDLLNNVRIVLNFYDLTFEDFKDSELLSEFMFKGIMDENDIDSIVKFKDAFEAKKQK